MSSLPLKPGWTIMKFGDFVEHIREQVQPIPEDSEHYIGLEHLDSGSLHVKHWGTDIELKGQKQRMKKGDLLFAKRNAYLRRIAIAPHDGLFSAHGMIFRPIPQNVLPEFLPFFLQSDTFMNRAIAISVGSLSPTINWSTLKSQEFPLPPKDEQRRIAEILWAADKVIEDWRLVKENLISSQNAILNNTLLVNSNKKNCGWKIVPLKNVAKIQTGIAKGKSYKNTNIKELPYLRVANVQDGYLDLSEIKTICVAEHEIERYSLKYGDVLLTEGGDFDKLGRGTIWRGEVPNCLHQNHVFSVRTDTSVLIPEFLSYQTGSLYGRRYFLKCSKKTSNLASINSTQVKGFPVLLPSITEQQRLINLIRPIEEHKSQIFEYLTALENLKKSIICRLLIQ